MSGGPEGGEPPKRLAFWGLWLEETLLADVPHRQVVLAVPKRLRPYLLYNRALLATSRGLPRAPSARSSARPWVSRALSVGIVRIDPYPR